MGNTYNVETNHSRIGAITDFHCDLRWACGAADAPEAVLDAAFRCVDNHFRLSCSERVKHIDMTNLLKLDLYETKVSIPLVVQVVALMHALYRLRSSDRLLDGQLYGVSLQELFSQGLRFAERHSGILPPQLDRSKLASDLIYLVDEVCRAILSDVVEGRGESLTGVRDHAKDAGVVCAQRFSVRAPTYRDRLDQTVCWLLSAMAEGSCGGLHYLWATMPEEIHEQWCALLKSGFLGGCFTYYMGDFWPIDRRIFIFRWSSDGPVNLIFVPKQRSAKDLTQGVSLPGIRVSLKLSRDKSEIRSVSSMEAVWLSLLADDKEPVITEPFLLDDVVSDEQPISMIDDIATSGWSSPLVGAADALEEECDVCELQPRKPPTTIYVTITVADLRFSSLTLQEERSISNRFIDNTGTSYPLCKTLRAMARVVRAVHNQGLAFGGLMLHSFHIVDKKLDEVQIVPMPQINYISQKRWGRLFERCQQHRHYVLMTECDRTVLSFFESLFEQLPLQFYSQYSSPELRALIDSAERLRRNAADIEDVLEFALGVNMPQDIRASDVWSLGKLWETLLLDSAQQQALMRGEKVVQACRASYMPELMRIEAQINRMLAAAVQDRPTIEEVVQELERIEIQFNGSVHIPLPR